MRVALTGAAGQVGRFIATHLLDNDVQLNVLRSTPAPVPGLHSEVQGRLVGAQTPNRLWDELLDGADACVHCAFSHTTGRYRQGEGKDPLGFWAHNLGNTLALLEAAATRGLSRVILLSSRAVLDGYTAELDQPRKFTERALLRPTTHYGALKAAEEALMARYAEETALATTTLRATGVYGALQPLAQSKWFSQFAALSAGRTLEPRCASEVHGLDLAAAVLLLLRTPEADVRGRVFNCSDVLVSHRDLVVAYNTLAGSMREVPDRGSVPLVQLDCTNLHKLGWTPRGIEGVHATLRALFQGQGTTD